MPVCADPYTGLTMNNMANVDGNGHSNCTNTTCDCRTRTVNLGLEMGRTYEIAVFGAIGTRSSPTTSSRCRASRPTSACVPRCGDGIRTGAEECDAATRRDRIDGSVVRRERTMGSYGGCTSHVQVRSVLRRRRGDAAAGEECDLGSRGNNVTYGNQDGCAPGCKYPHFCGDAVAGRDPG